MYRVGICDDGENICNHLEELTQRYARERNLTMETHGFGSGETLCDFLGQGNRLDILFLDIELLEMTGIEVGDFIRNQLDDRYAQIIYISGKIEYAQKLFKSQPLDFLVKPLKEQEVYEALDLAHKRLQRDNEIFEFSKGKDWYRIPFGAIHYFSSEGRRIQIYTDKETLEYNGKLQTVIPKLTDSFLVIHKSFIVNIEFVKKYSYDKVILMDGTTLAISKAYRVKVREELLRRGQDK